MKVALIIAALLIAGASGAALVPAAGQVRAYLPGATLLLSILVLVLLVLQFRRETTAQQPAVEPAHPAPQQAEDRRADAEVVHFLSMLQGNGRLVDFLMDEINAYSDTQVGAAARVVHAGCKGVLQEHFVISPVRPEPEGTTVQVPAGYPPDEYRLVGRIAGAAPFSGVLVHPGWKTDVVKLPRLLHGVSDRLPVIAPAEVEVK
jgi:hypothetical protein